MLDELFFIFSHLYRTIGLFSTFIIFLFLVPLVTLLVVWKNTPKMQVLALWVICMGIFEIWNNYLGSHKLNNHYTYHLYAVVEGIILGVWTLQSMHQARLKKLVSYLTAAFVLFATYRLSMHWHNFEQTIIIQSLMAILMSLLLFYDLLYQKHLRSLSSSATFWISCGIIIQFSGSFFVYLNANRINFAQDHNIVFVWSLTDFYILIFRILLTIGIVVTARETPSHLASSSLK
jgi:hypothetical protein